MDIEKLVSTAQYKGFISHNLLLTNDNYLWMCDLQRWLRELYQIEIIIYNTGYKYYEYGGCIGYRRENDKYTETEEVGRYDTYEEILYNCLTEALKMI